MMQALKKIIEAEKYSVESVALDEDEDGILSIHIKAIALADTRKKRKDAGIPRKHEDGGETAAAAIAGQATS